MQYWSIGVVEYWFFGLTILHYSITPLLHVYMFDNPGSAKSVLAENSSETRTQSSSRLRDTVVGAEVVRVDRRFFRAESISQESMTDFLNRIVEPIRLAGMRFFFHMAVDHLLVELQVLGDLVDGHHLGILLGRRGLVLSFFLLLSH